MKEENRIEIGSLGYLHAGWDDNYYPDGLPEDWRLDYYSHHFQFVLLKPAEWVNASEEAVRQWQDDVKDSFCFFLAINPDSVNQQLIAQIERIQALLKEQLTGLVIMGYTGQVSDENLQLLCALSEVHVDTDNTKLPPGTHGCWRKHRESNGVTIGFLASADASDMRVMRAQLETFKKTSDCEQAYLVYEGEPPSTQRMQDAQVILQLLA